MADAKRLVGALQRLIPISVEMRALLRRHWFAWVSGAGLVVAAGIWSLLWERPRVAESRGTADGMSQVNDSSAPTSAVSRLSERDRVAHEGPERATVQIRPDEKDLPRMRKVFSTRRDVEQEMQRLEAAMESAKAAWEKSEAEIRTLAEAAGVTLDDKAKYDMEGTVPPAVANAPFFFAKQRMIQARKVFLGLEAQHHRWRGLRDQMPEAEQASRLDDAMQRSNGAADTAGAELQRHSYKPTE